jgi:hypothetical protein
MKGSVFMPTIDTQNIKKDLLKLTKDDLTVSNISKLFGKTTVKKKGEFTIIPPKFDTKMPIHLDAGEYINTDDIDTTVGIILFNKLMIEGLVDHIVPGGFYNYVINKKTFSKLLDIISKALMSGKLPVNPNLIQWLKSYEFYSMKACTIFSPSYTRKLLETNEKIAAKKDELLKNTPIRSVQDMTKIEDTIVAMAREELKGDPGMTLFDSGARGSFENDYKNMNLMLGPVGVPGEDGKFELVQSNYIDGLKKEDFVAAGNTVVNSAYPKAVGTEHAGYQTKQFYAVYQSIVVDEDGTDCGTKRGIDIVLTEEVAESFLYQNIMLQSGRIVNLNPDTVPQYLNKKVKIRTPMFCPNDKCCSVCAGKRPYIMDIKNMGLTTGRISNTFLNKSMKAFHQSKVQLDVVDVDKLLL